MADQRRQDSRGAREQDEESVLVVFPGYHRSWASWIAHRLRCHGQRVTEYRWDPSREQPLDEALGDLLRSRGRVLLVLSDWFFQIGPRPAGDWNAVLRGYVAEHADRFAAVNLTNRNLLPATAVLEPVDVWGVGEEEAERRLLRRLALTPAPPAQVAAQPPGPRYPNDPVPVWGEVPRRNSRFTGRDALLNELHLRLSDVEQGASACALIGPSGIGKTHIATEYAHRFSPDYDVVWWVNSDQRGTLRDRLGELSFQLELTESSEPGERIRAVRRALHRGEPYKRWLLIFDGWEDTDEAAKYLPPGGTGHVLITTRNRAWSEHSEPFDIPGFQRGESVSYLMRRAPELSAAEADQVAEVFADVPIQLAQTAAYLGETGTSASEYLRMVREQGQDGGGIPLSQRFPWETLTSWSMTLNMLRNTDPHTIEVLALCCAFAPGRIPLGLVHGLSEGDLPPELRWISSDGPAWAHALDSLVKFSVLTRESRAGAFGSASSGDTEGSGGHGRQSVLMHSLAHSIISELIAGDSLETYRGVVRQLIAEADPGNPEEASSWPRYAELLPHLATSGLLSSTAPRAHSMLLNCLRYTHAGGEFRAGAELADQIREEWSLILDADSPAMLNLTTLQGNLLRASGRFEEAFALDSERLERLRSASDTDEGALLNATGCLAADQRFLGQYAEALQKQREVVSTALRLFGPDDEGTTLLAHHNLGVGLRLLGRYREAYEVDLDTLRRRESLLRPSHPATLASGNVCARDLRLMGRYQEAVARQELGVRRHRRHLGPDHPRTLWARHNLVLCEWRAGTAKQNTGEVLASLLEQIIQARGREHFSTLALITDYGNYQRVHGDLAEARDLISEAEQGYRQLLGQAHPVPTGMQSNAGLVLQAEGQRDLALNMFEQALAGLRIMLGPDHPATLGCALNAAGGRNFTGRVEDAAELSTETLGRARRVLGEEHPLTLSCQVALAADLRAAHESKEAAKLEDDALLLLARTLGPQHPHARSARGRVRPYWDFEPYLG
jgi:tetratricopeptide (TPR) repeat protein